MDHAPRTAGCSPDAPAAPVLLEAMDSESPGVDGLDLHEPSNTDDDDARDFSERSPPTALSPTVLERLPELAVNDPSEAPVSDNDEEGEPVVAESEWANEQFDGEEGSGGECTTDTRDSNPGDSISGGGSKRLDELHLGPGGKIVEGGERLCSFNTKAKDSPFFPYENLSIMLLFQLVHKYQFSEAMLTGLLAVLQTRHDGKGFDVDEIRDVSAKHFYDRRRAHHPLLEVVETKVPTSKDDGTTVPVLRHPMQLAPRSQNEIPYIYRDVS